MPRRPPSPCGTPGCAELVHGGGPCAKHKRQTRTASKTVLANRDKLYGRRWKKARAAYLWANPLCVFCERRGRVTAATVVDHIVPHRGDERLFWDRENWAPLCAPCHNGPKQAQEKSGVIRSVDADGMPTDPTHPWRRG